MSVLFVDLVALPQDDPGVLALAREWVEAGHAICYVTDANRPPPDWSRLPGGVGGSSQASFVTTAGLRYMARALDFVLREIATLASLVDRRRVVPPPVRFRPTPPRWGETPKPDGRPCCVATIPGVLTAIEAATYGLRLRVRRDQDAARNPYTSSEKAIPPLEFSV